MGTKKSFIIVDANSETVTSIRSKLSENKYELIRHFADGSECIAFLQSNTVDFIIFDFILQKIDGVAFLEWTKNNLSKNTKIFVYSNLINDNFVSKAIELGADYFFTKSTDKKCLEMRIDEILNSDSYQKFDIVNFTKTHRQLEGVITQVLMSINMPSHFAGYKFLREAVKLVVFNPNLINAMTKQLYPAIAKSFTTSSSKVERSMRHAIDTTWVRGKIDGLNRFLGCVACDINNKPSNSEFIALLADKLIVDGYEF